MNRSSTLPESLSKASLALLAAANVLFFLSFLIVALLASGKARAEAPLCSGTDLVAATAASDPALLAEAREEAAGVPNGQGLLWRVEKEGVAPSFLFGTMHVTDPRVVALTPPAEKGFAAARTLVIETTDILDKAKMTAAMMQRLDLTMLADATTLASLLSAEDALTVKAALESRGIPFSSVAKMRPWVISTMLALPACEMSRRGDGLQVLDEILAARAAKDGKAVAGLETALSQIEALASLPMDAHLASLVETARLGSRMNDVFETMIRLYETGESGLFMPLLSKLVPRATGQDMTDYAAFEETMILKRNRGMALNAKPFLDDGAAFIAVGALHLPGKEGVVELLRRDGYAVTRAD